MLGENILIRGGGQLDAYAGLLIGDDCIVSKNINIITRVPSVNDVTVYDPVVIGSGNYVDSDVVPGSIIPNRGKDIGLSNYNGQIVFVLGTGRSGSKAISSILSDHPDAECFHDLFPHLYRWSCDILYNMRTKEDVRNRLMVLYNATRLGKYKVHGQSEQKLAPLVPLLADMFPEAKFIWMIREADSFVNSSYPRGWFYNEEFGFPDNDSEFYPRQQRPGDFSAAHRLNGFLLGEFSKEEWQLMTAFERNCWYWNYWNLLIEENLKNIPHNRKLTIKLSELNQSNKTIYSFLILDPLEGSNADVINKAHYSKLVRESWTDDMEDIFTRHCDASMKKWFQ